MATETGEATTVVIRDGGWGVGIAGVIVAVAVLVAIAILGVYFANKSQSDAIQTEAGLSLTATAQDAAQSVDATSDRNSSERGSQ